VGRLEELDKHFISKEEFWSVTGLTQEMVDDMPREWVRSMFPEYYKHGIYTDVLHDIYLFCAQRHVRNSKQDIQDWLNAYPGNWKRTKSALIRRLEKEQPVMKFLHEITVVAQVLAGVPNAFGNTAEVHIIEAAQKAVVYREVITDEEFAFLVEPFKALFIGYNSSLFKDVN